MIIVMKSRQMSKCRHCSRQFKANGRGRPKQYCRASHRVRAHEKRRELENRQPTEKLFRLLKQRLLTLKRWRGRSDKIPRLDEIRRFPQLDRGKGYQKAVERVAELLTQLAPELFQDLVQPWRAALRGLEATRVIEQLEESAPWSAIRRKGL
jgi:hypothetical protein